MTRYFAFLLALFAVAAHASPGAHGPNGEHLDGAPGTVVADSAPRLEAASELYELVARLDNGRLRVFVDAYATNEPVLDASVEVETGALKAKGRFDAAIGDYVFDDPKLIEALSVPVAHSLVFTVMAGDDADLLEGKLIPPADAHDHGHSHALRWWLGLGAAVLVLGAVLVWRRRRGGGWRGGPFGTGAAA
jgi:hypothetical protein